MIDHIVIKPTGNPGTGVNNIYGTRVEKGKTIITGNVESRPYAQYVQVVAKGYHKGSLVQVDGQTISIAKNDNANYRFEMNENNNVDKVVVVAREQKDIAGKGEVVAYSTRKESGKIIIDSLVSSGFYKEKNLGIIASGLGSNKNAPAIETNTALASFSANTCQMQHVATSLDAGDKIKNVTATLAGDLQDTIQMRKFAYRVENGTYLVTSIIENGNTVPQTAGVQVIGYNKSGKIVEVNGYSDSIGANSTKQYKTILNNTKEIAKVNVELVGIVKGNVEEKHAFYRDTNNIVVTGISLNGSRKHNGGVVAMGYDKKGKVVDVDTFYGLLNEDSITPFILRLGNAGAISSVKCYAVDERSLKPDIILNGSGVIVDKTSSSVKTNAVITNGTTLQQHVGIISVGYNSSGKVVDLSLSGAIDIAPLTVSKIQNSLAEFTKITAVKNYLYGVKCSTAIKGSFTQRNANTISYGACIQNGSGDQNFTVKVAMYDLSGKVIPVQDTLLPIQKYCAQIYKNQFDITNVSRLYVKIYDANGKQLKSELLFNRPVPKKKTKGKK